MSNASPDASFSGGYPSQLDSSPNSQNDSSLLSQSFVDSNDDSILSAAGSSQSAEKHPKGKRKRTAAKDKMILEEAYATNPKPDKQARLEVVERVSLNEKEVQVCQLAIYARCASASPTRGLILT
jgi:uncharacterized protein YaiL (DUF2058 family)